MDDEKIVELYLNRDESAIGQTTEKYGRKLRALADGIVKDYQTAEECENDTYLAAWNSIPPHEPRSYLYAFLVRIVRHIALNVCRKEGRLKRSAQVCELSRELEECIPASMQGEHQLDDFMLRDAIDEFLSTLSESKRNVFIRRYWYLDSVSEISSRYGYSESMIYTMLHRIRIQFRKYLEKEGFAL